MDFLDKVKGLLTEPSKTFDALKEEPLDGAFKYYAVIAAVFSALIALMFSFASSFFGSMMGFRNIGAMMGAGAGIGAAIFFFVAFVIMAIAGAFISGAILHIFVYIAGGRKGITQTIKAVIYGSTPSLLFGWIPFLNLIAAIWSLVTEIIGLRQLHEITTGKAILAVVLLIISLVVVVFIIVAIFAAFIASFGGHAPYRY